MPYEYVSHLSVAESKYVVGFTEIECVWTPQNGSIDQKIIQSSLHIQLAIYLALALRNIKTLCIPSKLWERNEIGIYTTQEANF